jgi:hypothetical protein
VLVLEGLFFLLEGKLMKQLFLKCMIFLYAVIFAVFQIEAQNLEDEKQRITFDHISAEREDALVSRAFDGKPLKITPDLQIFPSDDQYLDVWRGNKPELSASIKSVTLNFSRTIAGKLNDNENFSINILNRNSDYVIQHSRPMNKLQIGGLRVAQDTSRKAQKYLFRGAKQSSVVLLLPYFSEPMNDRGGLFCLRDFINEGTYEQKTTLTDASYRLSSLSATVAGEVQGQNNNQLDMVMVRVGFATTEGVAMPYPAVDESYSKYASANLAYKPLEGSALVKFNAKENNTLGLQAMVEMHGPSGFLRRSKKLAQVFVKAINIDKKFIIGSYLTELKGSPIEAEILQQTEQVKLNSAFEVKVNSGLCYLVLIHNGSIIHEYLKEPFKLPERFSQMGQSTG